MAPWQSYGSYKRRKSASLLQFQAQSCTTIEILRNPPAPPPSFVARLKPPRHEPVVLPNLYGLTVGGSQLRSTGKGCALFESLRHVPKPIHFQYSLPFQTCPSSALTRSVGFPRFQVKKLSLGFIERYHRALIS